MDDITIIIPVFNIVRVAPYIRIFKQGYFYRILQNSVYRIKLSGNTNYDSPLPSEWHGKTIELEPVSGNDDEYAKNIDKLERSLFGSATGCLPETAPKMLAALYSMKVYFDSRKIRHYLSKVAKPCGEP